MKYGSWTLGNIEALINRIGEENARQLLDCKVTVDFTDGDAVVKGKKPTRKSRNFLSAGQALTLPGCDMLSSSRQFFAAREGLMIGDGARARVQSVKTVESLIEIKIKYFDLVRLANDWKIMSELPPDHAFTEEELWPHLQGMLERQWDGKNGPLITNDYANIFYVRDQSGEVFSVHADWVADRRKWDVDAYRLGDDRWGKGSRVFSRNC